ncbi:helix-turn-helix domain-containing protein [Paucibacter sp. JuS9]|uniref:helix-turn-helix domain-containing protein n=1 Tax=Paucibacter sp. JuS9 TaxID=3228748 RepID=UPI0037564C99
MEMKRFELSSEESAGHESERFATPLGETIRQIRMAKNQTLDEIAARSGLTKQAVRRIETGAVSNTTVGSLISIAEALGLRVGVLLFLAERALGKNEALVGHDIEALLPDLWYRTTGGCDKCLKP